MAGGVYPVYNIDFKINTGGRTGDTLVIIKDMETFSVAIDGNIVEWTPMDQEGWTRRLMTGKSMTIGLSGKRQEGDPGNDYVASMADKNGEDCNSQVEITLPSGAKIEMDCVVNLTSPFGGEAVDVSALEFELLSDGKPTFTPAPAG